MRGRYRTYQLAAAAFGMLILILDSKTALNGAKNGVFLCIYTVIPSLFPMLLLSIYLNSRASGISVPIISTVARYCGVPEGVESILITGLLGGYPVGAQAITQAYNNKAIDRDTAHKLLGFCSNAGPAFIFGIASGLFSSIAAVWILWLIHILSALFTGYLLSKKTVGICKRVSVASPLGMTACLSKSIITLAQICGWVTLFRVVIAFLERWLFWLFPNWLCVIVTGLLELTNGCIGLHSVENEGLRLILCAAFLSFGGLCVTMQTASVASSLKTIYYIKGKAIQSLLCIPLAYTAQLLLFPKEQQFHVPLVPAVILLGIVCTVVFARKSKKIVAKSCVMMYNVH